MKVTCDHCTRTASGLLDDLLDAGWFRLIVTAPFQRTFTGCPDHARLVPAAAVAAMDAEMAAAGRRRTLVGVVDDG